MGHRARKCAWPVMAVLLAGPTPAGALAQEPTPLPFDPTLSIYVAHSGSWLNAAGDDETTEIEDPVAAFHSSGDVSDQPTIWAERQINVPAVPKGWGFFSPEWDLPAMGMHVVVRDAQKRLLEVRITDPDTEAPIGTLHANFDGSEIDGSVSVDPEAEAFRLDVIENGIGETLFVALANNPTVDDAVVVTLTYGWTPNCGEKHEPCPAHRSEPFGPPESTDGKTATDLAVPTPACAGTAAFANDGANPTALGPRSFVDRRVVKDTTAGAGWMGLGGTLSASQAIAVARRPYEASPDEQLHPFLKQLEIPPFSKGTGHWPMILTGELHALLYCPYRGRRKWKAEAAAILWEKAERERRQGLGQAEPSKAVAAAVRATWGPEEEKLSQAGPPVALGDIWGLRASAPDPPTAMPLIGITAPVTFELWADLLPPAPGAPGRVGGTGRVEAYEPWDSLAPPEPVPRVVELSFPADGPEKGRCTVELALGWEWKATGTPAMQEYAPGEIGRVSTWQHPTERIECHLAKLLALSISTKGRGDKPVPARVELERQTEGDGWAPAASGDTVKEENGDQVWCTGPLSLDTYRLRFKGEGPWSEWAQFIPEPSLAQRWSVYPPPAGAPAAAGP